MSTTLMATLKAYPNRLEASEGPAGQSCHHVDLETLPDLRRKIRPAEADGVDHVSSLAQRELRVTTVRSAGTDHDETRDADRTRLVHDPGTGRARDV